MGVTKFVLLRLVPVGAVVAASAAAGLLGLELTRSRVAGDVYRERLAALSGEYDALAARYNAAVRRSAVTELVVKGGRLDVVVRTAAGELERVRTPYDPSSEIYVDFALVDGRVWIRRVFDARTPPAEAVVIDPALATVDWDAPRAVMGKAVYRSLAEGRWVVTVSGGGSLELRRAEAAEPSELMRAPEVASFEAVEAAARREAEAVGWREVLERTLRW